MFSVSGFIKIPRAFFEGTLWCEARVFSRAEAFLDLVRLVRYRMGTVQDGPRGEKIPVGRGEVLVSLRNLGERWQWSAHRVKCFVDDLVKEGILCYETVGTGHKLTIQQYDSLYGRKIREERKIPRCGTASGTPPAPGHKGLSAGGGNSLGNTCGVQGTVVERKVAKEREEEKETSLEGGKEKLLSGATVQSGAVSPTSAGQGQASPVAPSAATAAQDVPQGAAGSRPAVVQAVRPSALCLEPLVTAGYAELPLAECRTALVAERSWLETLTMNSRLSGHRELTLDGVRRWLDDFFRKLENEGGGAQGRRRRQVALCTLAQPQADRGTAAARGRRLVGGVPAGGQFARAVRGRRGMVRFDFKAAIGSLRDVGLTPVPETVRVAIPGARDLIAQGLRHFVGPAAKWLPEYEAVAAWLAENRGRGLLAMGNCGRGKTLVVGRIVPLLIHHYARRIVACYDVQAMNADPDGVRRKHLLYLDDIGTEDLSVRYGERRMVFPEIVDEAEKRGKLLLVTTNLNPTELRAKYGERTLDRLRAITTAVVFKGESLRGIDN